jgi:hypothetical protein
MSVQKAAASGPPRKLTRYSPGSRAMKMPSARSSAAASSKRERAGGASMFKSLAHKLREARRGQRRAGRANEN